MSRSLRPIRHASSRLRFALAVFSVLSVGLLAPPSCGTISAWNHPFSSVIELADVGGDGHLDRADWDRLAYSAPAFGVLDTDGDGALSEPELLAATLAQDAVDFDQAARHTRAEATTKSPVFTQPEIFHPGTYETRMVRELLVFLADEVRAADPSVPVPPKAELVAAAGSGDPESPPVLAALRALKRCYAQAGLQFPPQLLPEAAP
jgi:hypothetical protein